MKKLVALLFVASLWLTAAGRPIQLQDYYRVETASAPVISPDGRWVVFTRNSINEAENRRETELWIASADGTVPAKKLAVEQGAAGPRWSPDGKLLSFRVTRRGAAGAAGGRGGRGGAGGDGDTWFLRVGVDGPGGDAFQIAGVAGAPIFSPDNRWIAFTKRTPPQPVMEKPRIVSEQDKLIDQRFRGRMYDWMNARFDGRGYLPDPRDPSATPPNELYVVSRDGGTAKQITRLGVDVSGVAWRPDSGALSIVANSHQRDEYSYERADLWIVDTQSAAQGNAEIKRLTDDGFDYDSPTWSPDGKSLLCRRRQSLNQILQAKQRHGSAVDLYRVDAAGGKLTNLTADFDLIPDAPSWSGANVYFAAAVGGDTQLFRIASAGGAVVQMTKGDRALGGFSFSQAFDRMAYTMQDSTHPAEAFSAKLDGTSEVRLSAFSEKFLKDVEISAAERIRFKSKDGTPVEGWVIQPRGGKSSAPLILAIHGGPHGAYGTHFDFEFQLLAASGYGVVYTNPRGSTGYGEKFLWGTWGGWGKLDYEDVMAGVDYAVERFKFDPKRLGVTGYSYGGYMTDWIITQTDRFAAAVAGAGISNWISDYGTADIPRSKESEFFGSPWQPEANALMRSQSPITYAGRVRTPTLFVHGEADLRVPIEQAEQMYTALKKLRVPAKFIRYPGNYHGGWPAWDMVHRYHHELQWWDQYLGGKAPLTGESTGGR